MRTLITAPAAEPVTTAELKAQLRIVRSNEDTLLDRLITAARIIVEKAQWRQLITATWSVSCRAFPEGTCPIKLPFPPLQTVTHVKYYDTSDTLTTFASTKYDVLVPTSGPGLIQLDTAEAWPEVIGGRSDAVQIQFVCGYGAAGSSVPATTKSAILMLAAELYTNRAATPGGSAAMIAAVEWSNAIESLIQIEACRVRMAVDSNG